MIITLAEIITFIINQKITSVIIIIIINILPKLRKLIQKLNNGLLLKSHHPTNAIHYNFPTLDHNLHISFFFFNSFVLIKNIKNKIIKTQIKSMLVCGSFCNFISSNLISKLNLKSQALKKKVLIKGISGDIDSILKFVPLKFQHKICINNKIYLIQRKLIFLVTDNIPMDRLSLITGNDNGNSSIQQS